MDRHIWNISVGIGYTIHRKSSNFRRVAKEIFDIISVHVVRVNQIEGICFVFVLFVLFFFVCFESYGNTLKGAQSDL